MKRAGTKLPPHYLRDRLRHRALTGRMRFLPRGCREYAQWLVMQRWGPGECGASKAKAAAALGCSTRTIQRYNLMIVAVGLFEVVDEGGIVAGRRFVKVFRMLFPQVNQGDTVSPQRSKRPSYWTRRATHGHQLSLEIPLPDRTTTRQPRAIVEPATPGYS